MCGNNRARSECFQLRFARATHVGIDLHRHRLDNVDLTPHEPETASESAVLFVQTQTCRAAVVSLRR